MARIGDGRVSAYSVAIDIWQNMIPATTAAAAVPAGVESYVGPAAEASQPCKTHSQECPAGERSRTDATVLFKPEIDAMRASLDRLEKLNATPAAAPAPAAQPAVPDGLVAALRRQRQCDEDGAECIVSRQACDEAANILEALPQPFQAITEREQDSERIDWLEKNRQLSEIHVGGKVVNCYAYAVAGAPGVALRAIIDAARGRK